MRRHGYAVLGALALAVLASDARALKFEQRILGGRLVLLLFDCGDGDGRDEKTQCAKSETRFSYEGPFSSDSVRLAGALSRQRYEEVWLASGGGTRSQGIAVGRLLRAYRMVVRVPSLARLQASTGQSRFTSGGSCVSACTLAFMGGLLRYVDEAAELQIHSSSSVQQEVPDEILITIRDRGVRGLAEQLHEEACRDVLVTLRYFQNTLLLPTGAPPVREDDSYVRQEAMPCTQEYWYSDSDEARDKAQLSIEGIASVQDLLMRMERGAVKAALNSWQQRLSSLGRRAEPAHKMVAARFDVVILSTNSLSRESLISMGYVTREVSAGTPDDDQSGC